MQTRRQTLACASAGFLLLCCGQVVPAATYHVSPGGSDAAPGSEARPWKTLSKAAASVAPGDTVLIGTGEYFVGPTWRVSKAGTEERPITYRSAQPGQARITSASVLPADGWTHVKGAIYSTPAPKGVMCVFHGDLPLHHPGERAKIFSVDDLIPNSFYVADKKTLYVWLADGSHPKDSLMRAAPGHVVSLYDCHYSILDGLVVEYGFNGIKDQGKRTHHITIRNCTIRSISSQGIQPVAQDCVIEGNLFQKIGTNKYEHGIYGSKVGTIIRRNVFEEISGAGVHQYNGNSPAGGNCEISGNIFRKPRKMTVRQSGPPKDRYYLDIIAWGQGGNRIFNNVFYGEGKRGGISLNSVDNRVYHNTFIDSTWAIGFHAGKGGNRVMNNLMVNSGGSFLVWPVRAMPQTLDYNLYWPSRQAGQWQRDGTSHHDFAAYRKASGEAHSICADPVLSGPADARPRAGSKAVDAGTALEEVRADFEGVARPQGAAPDIGAYELKAQAR